MKFASDTTRLANPYSDGFTVPPQAQRRECKLLLASLLFTGSLVAFVITSLPQILSLPTLDVDQQSANATRLNPSSAKTLSITVSPSADAETVHLSVSSESTPSGFSASEIQPSIETNDKDKTVAIALSASTADRYTINVTVQPSESHPPLLSCQELTSIKN
ncbi:hypothetical protein IFO70_17055 [Phormidium tenue FACHB-886]|nr:hypothetical protein [Phormidium tenue FACHB-886]